MRRRPGIQGLQKGAQTRVRDWSDTVGASISKAEFRIQTSLQDQYKVLGEHVQQSKLEHIKSQMAVFKKSLEEFAIKHRCALLSVTDSPEAAKLLYSDNDNA